MKEQGGFLTYDDLARHHSEWVDPVTRATGDTTYRRLDLWYRTTLQMLNILEGYDIAAMGFGSWHIYITLLKPKNWHTRTGHDIIPIWIIWFAGRKAYFRTICGNTQKAITRIEQLRDMMPGLNLTNTIYLTVADKAGRHGFAYSGRNYRGMG